MKNKGKQLLTAAIIGLMIAATGCKKDSVSIPGNTATLKIGGSYMGGVIAYILKPGEPGYDANLLHGIIAAPSDQASNASWMLPGAYVKTNATDKEVGTGLSNTNLISQKQGAGNYAAAFCTGLNLSGYHDWFLPSVDELSLLYASKEIIGGFTGSEYWTSTEYSLNSAEYEDFANGNTYAADKIKIKSVRAIKYF